MLCNDLKSLISEYVDNPESDGECKYIKLHLDSCQECKTYFRTNESIKQDDSNNFYKNKFHFTLYKVIGICVVLLSIYLAFSYFTTVSLEDNKSIIKYIVDNTDLKKNDIEINKIESNGNYKCVVYTVKDRTTWLLVFTQEFIYKNRYHNVGKMTASNSINVYNLEVSTETIKIVYGNNTKLNAYSYTITNNNIRYSENISNKKYILRIYRIPNTKIHGDELYLYDKSGNVVKNAENDN